MKDVRFYLEFPDERTKRKSGRANHGHSGNVMALFENRLEGLAALFEYSNSPVASTGTSRGYLRRCKRIPEELARSVHPTLFDSLDANA